MLWDSFNQKGLTHTLTCTFLSSLYIHHLYGCEIWGAYIIQPTKLLGPDDLSGYLKKEFDKLHLSCENGRRTDGRTTDD